MLFSRSAAGLVSVAVLLTGLTACANSPNSKNLEQILAADPRLRENPVRWGASGAPQQQPEANRQGVPSSSGTPGEIAQLPPGFPNEIPLYPNAQLVTLTQPTSPNTAINNNFAPNNQTQQIVWFTPDPINLVQSFYQKEFQANNWEIVNQPTDAQQNAIAAHLNDLQVTVSIAPGSKTNTDSSATPSPSSTNPTSANLEVGTEFIIQYERNASQTAQTPTAPQPGEPQPGEPGFIGPTLPQQTPNQPSPAPETAPQTATTGNQSFSDLNTAPQELRQYITDLVALGVLPLEQTGSKSNQADIVAQFSPGKTITRREFARWLVAANNQIHANRPSQQIRAASTTAQPAFPDVPRTDPDFPVIQGLAEAGLIPSSLSGDATAVLFRPNAPLTREQLILWKVPLDTRQALPKASVDAVRESWGFQDVARIEPSALRAMLADFQNGEQSNIRRVFGYTALFQPKKPVTRAEAAAALWYFGASSEGISAQEAIQIKQQQNQPQSQPSATPEGVPSSSPS